MEHEFSSFREAVKFKLEKIKNQQVVFAVRCVVVVVVVLVINRKIKVVKDLITINGTRSGENENLRKTMVTIRANHTISL